MQVIKYNKAKEQYIHYNRSTGCIRWGGFWELGQRTFGRVALLMKEDEGRPFDYIHDRTYKLSCPSTGITLFVSSSSKIPRDLIRNSGYKITRDIDKANYVVIPWVEDDNPFSNYICGIFQGDLYIFPLSDAAKSVFFEPEQHELDIITKHLKEKYDGIELYCSPIHCKQNIYYIRNVEEHKALFNKDADAISRRYVWDSWLPLTPSTGMSPESLTIIQQLPDKRDAIKLLMQMDFQKYPFTTCVFLRQCLGVSYGYMYGDQANWMMKAIGYDDFDNDDYYRRPILPEDFNMLQDFLMFRLGIKDSGIVQDSKIRDFTWGIRELLVTRVAVKKLSIDHPMNHKDLMSLIKNLC